MSNLKVDLSCTLLKPEVHTVPKSTRIVGVALGALMFLGGVLFLSGAFAVAEADLLGGTFLVTSLLLILPLLFVDCKRQPSQSNQMQSSDQKHSPILSTNTTNTYSYQPSSSSSSSEESEETEESESSSSSSSSEQIKKKPSSNLNSNTEVQSKEPTENLDSSSSASKKTKVQRDSKETDSVLSLMSEKKFEEAFQLVTKQQPSTERDVNLHALGLFFAEQGNTLRLVDCLCGYYNKDYEAQRVKEMLPKILIEVKGEYATPELQHKFRLCFLGLVYQISRCNDGKTLTPEVVDPLIEMLDPERVTLAKMYHDDIHLFAAEFYLANNQISKAVSEYNKVGDSFPERTKRLLAKADRLETNFLIKN